MPWKRNASSENTIAEEVKGNDLKEAQKGVYTQVKVFCKENRKGPLSGAGQPRTPPLNHWVDWCISLEILLSATTS